MYKTRLYIDVAVSHRLNSNNVFPQVLVEIYSDGKLECCHLRTSNLT
jgi:hypothetical protein